LRCPDCGAELLEVGYPDELGFQKYRCPNGCKFVPPISWKVWNAFGYAIWIVATFSALIILSPFLIARFLFDKLKN